MNDHFLVATADPDLGILIEEALKSMGHSVSTVTKGGQAVTRAVAESPRALIVERELPGLNADEILRNLQSFDSTRYMPVVLLMNKRLETEKISALRVGVDHVLLKPITLDVLKVVLERIGQSESERVRG